MPIDSRAVVFCPSSSYVEEFTNRGIAMISQDLLNILVCPLGKAELRLEEHHLVCTRCGVKYRIEDDIPIMLIEEAELPAGVTSIDQLECAKAARA